MWDPNGTVPLWQVLQNHELNSSRIEASNISSTRSRSPVRSRSQSPYQSPGRSPIRQDRRSIRTNRSVSRSRSPPQRIPRRFLSVSPSRRNINPIRPKIIESHPRTFSMLDITTGKLSGRYVGNQPGNASKKCFTQFARRNRIVSDNIVYIYIRETTINSKHKIYKI